MFDDAVSDAVKAQAPSILYHYTTWSGVEGILSSQRFWATAHDCTNDEAELTSADEVIMGVAREMRANAMGTPAAVLDLFLKGYPQLQLTKLRTIYLICFSLSRDDKGQWLKYADNGCGVCLGIRLLNECGPEDPRMASKLLEVDYSEASWRESVATNFRAVCALLSRSVKSGNNIELGLSALYRIAAFKAIGAKKAPWKDEQEYRCATIIHANTTVEPLQRISGGKIIRYLPIRVRKEGRRIALAEIMLGPNQNTDDKKKHLEHLLKDCGYNVGDIEYPKITVSENGRWQSQ